MKYVLLFVIAFLAISCSFFSSRSDAQSIQKKRVNEAPHSLSNIEGFLPSSLPLTRGGTPSKTFLSHSPSVTIHLQSYIIGSENLMGTYSDERVDHGRLFIYGKPVPGEVGGTFQQHHFKFWVKPGLLVRADCQAVLKVYDKQGHLLGEAPIHPKPLASSLHIHPYVMKQEYITGTYKGTDPYTSILFVNGQEIESGGSFLGGKFQFWVRPGAITKENRAHIVLKSYDAYGNELDSQSVPVQDSL